eukprot:scaffold231628_cov34-Prasinocladus_malaysianus.AAC.1
METSVAMTMATRSRRVTHSNRNKNDGNHNSHGASRVQTNLITWLSLRFQSPTGRNNETRVFHVANLRNERETKGAGK